MKKKLALLGLLSPLAAFSEDAAWVVPDSVTGAMTELQTAAGKVAEAEIPFIKGVGLALLGVTLIVAIFGFLRWSLRKAAPGGRG